MSMFEFEVLTNGWNSHTIIEKNRKWTCTNWIISLNFIQTGKTRRSWKEIRAVFKTVSTGEDSLMPFAPVEAKKIERARE